MRIGYNCRWLPGGGGESKLGEPKRDRNIDGKGNVEAVCLEVVEVFGIPQSEKTEGGE